MDGSDGGVGREPMGELKIEVLHVPGHSPGHVAYFEPVSKSLFSGDCLFAGSIGRSDLPGGSHEILMASIENVIFPLGDDVKVYSGHGPMTTVQNERLTNPFFGGGGAYDPFSMRDFYSFEAFFADIEERGLYAGAHASGNWGPSIKLSTPEQKQQLADFRKRYPEAEVPDSITRRLESSDTE